MLINNKVAEKLNDQLNLEIFSSYLYLEIANYFVEEGLDGFANWMDIQVQEELDHAKLILNYLHENDVKVRLDKIDNPTRDYEKHIEALEEVLDHEKLITRSIHDIYDVAFSEKDFRSLKFLDWFVEEQGEEEANASELITKYELFGDEKKGLYLLDKELGQRVHVAPAALTEE